MWNLFLCKIILRQLKQTIFVDVLRAIDKSPLYETFEHGVGMVVRQSDSTNRNLAICLIFEQSYNLVEMSLIENLLTLLIDVKREQCKVATHFSALQVKDIGKRVEGNTQRVAANGGIEETVVA